MQTATFGAGCFWKPQSVFNKMKGVLKTEVGYMGGHINNPTYKEVCYKDTGHAEVVKVEFDEKIVTYKELLDMFWKMHNPTTLNQDGPNLGSQYRSVIFYYSPEQKKEAESSKKEAQKKWKDPIVTQIAPAVDFWKAEEFHQDFLEKNGRVCGI